MRWQETRLKYLAAAPITNGLGEQGRDAGDGSVRYIRTTDIAGPRQLDSTKWASLPPDVARRAMVARGDLLICAAGSLGVTYLHDSDEPACYAGYLARFRPGRMVDPRFVAYWAQSQAFFDQVSTGAVRSTIDNFSAGKIRNLKLAVPPLDEQCRISDFLDSETVRLDRLILARQAQLSLLPARWRSVLDGVYTSLAERNGVMPLGRHLVRIEQGTSPQCDNVEADNDEWGVLKAGAVKGDRFLPKENKRLPSNIATEVRYEIHAGDLLITRANTPALVGAAAVVPAGVRTRLILCDKIFRLRLSPSLRPDYVSLLSQASAIRDARAANATGASSSMVNLTNQDVKAWPLPIASPLEQQVAIEHLMRARDSQHHLEQAITAQLTVLSERRHALIAASVTGQFDAATAGGSTL